MRWWRFDNIRLARYEKKVWEVGQTRRSGQLKPEQDMGAVSVSDRLRAIIALLKCGVGSWQGFGGRRIGKAGSAVNAIDEGGQRR